MQAITREEIRVGPVVTRFLVEGEQTSGSVAVFEFDVPAGTSVAAAHSHDGFEETIYGLEGVLTWTVEGDATEIGPGDTLCIPRGAVHQVDNPRATDAKALAIVTPGILGPVDVRARRRRDHARPGRPTTASPTTAPPASTTTSAPTSWRSAAATAPTP